MATAPRPDVRKASLAAIKEAVRDCRNAFSWQIPPEALTSDRLDLRSSHADCVCSIDPIGCEDIDDALSIKILPNGNVQFGAHIADVTYFVPHEGKLDLEARNRSTSVYLADR